MTEGWRKRSPGPHKSAKRRSYQYLNSMAKERIITQEQFDELLAWFDPDREQAGRKYETIRQSLIRIFIWRGYSEAEDMADETINRVLLNVIRIKPTFIGDPAPYFYRVANNLLMERGRQKKLQVPLEEVSEELSSEDNALADEQVDNLEQEDECLHRCIQQLEPDRRALILAYYREEKQAKIEYRRKLAQQERIDLNALRVRVYRIRAGLEKCIEECLQQKDNRP